MKYLAHIVVVINSDKILSEKPTIVDEAGLEKLQDYAIKMATGEISHHVFNYKDSTSVVGRQVLMNSEIRVIKKITSP